MCSSMLGVALQQYQETGARSSATTSRLRGPKLHSASIPIETPLPEDRDSLNSSCVCACVCLRVHVCAYANPE